MWDRMVETCQRRMAEREANGAAALLALRVIVGYGFMVHVWAKA